MEETPIPRFDPDAFENFLPHEMRFKEADLVNENEIFWVTQEPFTVAQLRQFQQAVRDYAGDIRKFYVTPRDLSGYNFEEDMARGVLAVVTPDAILKDDYVRAMRQEGLEEYLGPENGGEETAIRAETRTPPRLFVDMDGTLARFHDEVQYLERMYEPGFFQGLQPFGNAVETVRLFLEIHPECEVYILSAVVPGDPPDCERQKQAWLDEHLPEIDRAHRLFPEMGTDKSAVIPGGIRKTDVLLDDYNKNLEEWRRAGGDAVKFVNNINDQALHGPRWGGARLYYDASPQMSVIRLDRCLKEREREISAVPRQSAPPRRGPRL